MTAVHPCPPAEDLKACVDGELGMLEGSRLRAHVQSCARCAEEIEAMKLLGREIRGLEAAAEAPAGLRHRVLSRLEFQPEGPRRLNRYRVLQWATGALLAAMFAAAALPPLLTPAKETARIPSMSPMKGAARAAGQRQPQAAAGMSDAAPAGGAAGKPFATDLAREPRFSTPGQDYDEISRNQAAPIAGMPVPASVPTVTPDDVEKWTRGKAIEDVRRKVVKTADIGVRVNRALESAQDDVALRVRDYGGYVENSNLASPEGGPRAGHMVLRVPVEKFDAALAYFATLGEITAKNIRGEDVTGAWIDQRAEVREMRETERRLIKAYENAKTKEERWEAQWQLLQLRPRMKAAEERFALTSKLAALSTVNLTLTEEPQARVRGNLMHDLDNTVRGAVAAFMLAIRVPAALVIWLVVFLPLWLPSVFLYRWAGRMARLR